MLNKSGQRELAYVVKVDAIEPIVGRDRVECARIGGWTCMVQKDSFHPGDLGVYFEIDSKVDTTKEVFAFTEKYHGKIKTQKFTLKDENGNKVGQFCSQGLLMPLSAFELDDVTEGDFLTEKLGVTYSDPDDNKRKSSKSNTNAKYQRMMNRHPKLAKSKFGRFCMKYKLSKIILYTLLGGDKKNAPKKFPYWVSVTDEERVQNCFNQVKSLDTKWIATEKRDGTSTTFTLKRNGKKFEYVVCSRHVVMTNNKDGGWYDNNVYTEMADKYNVKEALEKLIDSNSEIDFVTIQGESFGEGIQKRDYGLKEHVFEAFNLIYGYKNGTTKRLNPYEMKTVLDTVDIPTVPIIDTVELPETCEEVLNMASGDAAIYGGMREGIVFRSLDGVNSFKAVDNDFLLKYH